MPEGHTVHRTANQFNELFAGQRLTVDSPQGRFGAGAAQVNALVLTRAFAVGKQLFLEFDGGLFVRIHLGIYGKWRWYRDQELQAALANEPIGQVRARFYTDQVLADLRGPTVCEVIVAESGSGRVAAREAVSGVFSVRYGIGGPFDSRVDVSARCAGRVVVRVEGVWSRSSSNVRLGKLASHVE